jgi:hypothetical protein
MLKPINLISQIAFRLLAVCAVALSFVGCASVKMSVPTADIGTIEKLRAAGIAPTAVGSFVLAPGKDPAMDKAVGGLRGSSISASTGSYATQLREQVIADLRASGLLSDNSKTVISGQLTDSKLDAAISTGTGRLAAIFFVDREGKRVFQKELAIDAQWPSSFMGAIAIPAAINEYTSLYKKLSQKLFDDADFRAAVK